MVENKATHRYHGEAGKEYFESHFQSDLDYGRIYQMRHFLPYVSENDVVLDLGSAHGLYLRNLPAKRRIGVEVNRTAIEECNRLSAEQGIPIEVHENLEDVESGVADTVISNHCLEHIPHPLAAMQNVLRILKPGGTFALVVPFDDWRNPVQKEWRPNDPDHHLYTWSPLNLGNLLAETGFDVQFTRMNKSAWSPKFFFIRKKFGEATFELACRLFAAYKQRREVVAVARKPA